MKFEPHTHSTIGKMLTKNQLKIPMSSYWIIWNLYRTTSYLQTTPWKIWPKDQNCLKSYSIDLKLCTRFLGVLARYPQNTNTWNNSQLHISKNPSNEISFFSQFCSKRWICVFTRDLLKLFGRDHLQCPNTYPCNQTTPNSLQRKIDQNREEKGNGKNKSEIKASTWAMNFRGKIALIQPSQRSDILPELHRW